MRQPAKVEFVKASVTHAPLFPGCRELVNRTQGENVFPADYFPRYATNPDTLLLLALCDDELIGVATARLLPSDGFVYYLPFGDEVSELFRNHRVGSMECASVQESWQGRGVGHELARRRVAWLEEMGCAVIIGIAWESGLPHTSDRVFRRLGFEQQSRVKDFYNEISVQRGFICPVCGPPPCRCAASLFVNHINAVCRQSARTQNEEVATRFEKLLESPPFPR